MKYHTLPLWVLVALLLQSLATAASGPNVLFIAVDDLRCELGCYGVKEIKSPNIDRLAARGVVFDHAYCQQAVCNPSRASLLTGLRPDTIRVWDLVTSMRKQVPDVVTLPQYFKQNGYYTVGMGKIFHNTFPDPRSWSVPQQPAPAPTFEYSEEVLKKLNQARTDARRAGMTEQEIANRIRGPATECVDVPDNQRYDGSLGDLALKELRKAAAQKAPFFFAVGFIRPHLPFTPPKKYWDLYDPANLPLAPNGYLPRGMPTVAFGDKSMGGMYELRDCMDFKNAPSPFVGSLPEVEQRRLKHGYYASVSFTDVQVGRLLDEADRLGFGENTIIILWGDHGWKLGLYSATW
jgi:iduronate 2-sulfatase